MDAPNNVRLQYVFNGYSDRAYHNAAKVLSSGGRGGGGGGGGGGGIHLHHQRCGILHVYATVSWPILSSLLLTLFTGATHSEVFTSIPG